MGIRTAVYAVALAVNIYIYLCVRIDLSDMYLDTNAYVLHAWLAGVTGMAGIRTAVCAVALAVNISIYVSIHIYLSIYAPIYIFRYKYICIALVVGWRDRQASVGRDTNGSLCCCAGGEYIYPCIYLHIYLSIYMSRYT